MILLRTDGASAAVMFATPNTTRARLDLIQRLAKIRITDKALARSLTALVERFSESTKVRNELKSLHVHLRLFGRHHPYPIDAIGGNKVQPQIRRDKTLDEGRQQEMLRTTNEMMKINRDIWDFLPRLEAHVCGGAQPQGLPTNVA